MSNHRSVSIFGGIGLLPFGLWPSTATASKLTPTTAVGFGQVDWNTSRLIPMTPVGSEASASYFPALNQVLGVLGGYWFVHLFFGHYARGYGRHVRKPFLIALLCSAPFAQGQSNAPPEFEVASVKQFAMDPLTAYQARESIEAHPGSVIMRNVSMLSVIPWTYDIQLSQVLGIEKLPRGRYEILAKAEEATPVPQMRLMMQTLLADRFKLAVHRETRETRSYALVVSKPSARLHASDGERDNDISRRRGTNFSHASMPEFADFISMPMSAAVIDRTGLQGRFDFSIDLSPDENWRDAGDVIPAMQKQLGLKLESSKAPIEMLVIDRVAKVPTEN